MSKQAKKTIAQKLTKRHQKALYDASKGEYVKLFSVCLEARDAIRVIQAVQGGHAAKWRENTLRYYAELLEHLESYLPDGIVKEAYYKLCNPTEGK